MSGRLVPFALVLLLFALLPFLGGQASGPPTSVVLAAGSPAAVQDAVDAVGQARDELVGLDPAVTASASGAAFSPAAGGGGLFLFPAVDLAPVTATVAVPLAGAPFFIHPVPGGETSPFGPRIHPLLGRPMFHTGIDLAAACGTPIRAAADGTVIYARVSASWGGRTIIQHTPTVKTAYGHQSKFLVTEGQQVKQGQVIGLSGTTGWSTGCHLHFDVIVDDRYVDPAPYLGFPPSTSASVPYAAVPQLSLNPSTLAVGTVQDGDVPISQASVVPLPTGTAPPLPVPASSPSASTSGPAATTRPAATSGTTTTTSKPVTTAPVATTPVATTPVATTPVATTPATTPASTPPTSSTPPPAATSTAASPPSTTPPPTTTTGPATPPSTTTVATPTTTGATCPTSGPSPATSSTTSSATSTSTSTTISTTTSTDPACQTQAPAPGG